MRTWVLMCSLVLNAETVAIIWIKFGMWIIISAIWYRIFNFLLFYSHGIKLEHPRCNFTYSNITIEYQKLYKIKGNIKNSFPAKKCYTNMSSVPTRMK